MNAVNSVTALRVAVAEARAHGRRIGFVPTMGALHEGHLTLCDAARQRSDFVVLSAFVNPLQFGAGEDLERYPRAAERDAQLAAGRGVDLLFTPNTAEMYPRGDALIRVSAPMLADRLCGAFRPGHFEGVLTVVAKLFNLVRPDVAIFGQKDLQQAALVRRMVRDLDFPLDVVIAPIIREPDGLALSSRNVYLSRADRTAALALSQALHAAQQVFRAGVDDPALLIAAARAVLAADARVVVQYIELVDPETLDTPTSARRGDAIAIAAFVGNTRLIDNHLLA